MDPLIWFLLALLLSSLLAKTKMPFLICILPMAVFTGFLTVKSGIFGNKFIFEKVEKKDEEKKNDT